MPKHIEPYDNKNEPIVDIGNETVPLVYFNCVRLKAGERFEYQLTRYESCIVPVSGCCSVTVEKTRFDKVGSRRSLWQGVPNAVYVPVGMDCVITAEDDMELFIAGGLYNETLEPFAISDEEVDLVQYGSDETKTHRKIKHILGQRNVEQRGRLLVSELFTVGQGGWSGFPPHKHDTENPPEETRYEEVYKFRCNAE